MTTDDFVFKDPSFKKEFWEWFDSIPRTERDRFKQHSADMAELYFYNKYYRKRMLEKSNVTSHSLSSADR